MTKLLANNYKLAKSVPGWTLTGLSLAPHTMAGRSTVCPYSTAECRAVCLGTETGLNVLPSALKAKVARTHLWLDDPETFKSRLNNELYSALKAARRDGTRLGVRLNVYSDIRWEIAWPEVFAMYPEVQFYDYTKWPRRYERPRNYHLTYSYSGTNASKHAASEYMVRGVNVAVVFPEEVPDYWEPPWPGGFKMVINGDLNDFRPGDARGVIVGLKFKGPRENLVSLRKFVAKESAHV